MAISQRIVVKMYLNFQELSAILLQEILQFQSDKIKGVEVMHVLAMSGMSFWTWDNLIELEMYKKL